MRRAYIRNSLLILSIQTSRAEKPSCYRMMEAKIHLDISGERGIQC